MMYHPIFLLSHMRANTSLISHILGSHPEISGYYEMHLSYQSEHDLVKQLQLYSSKETIKNSSRFLFDKLLHNDYELRLENLGTTLIKTLVSIRPPEQTIKSILNLFRKKDVDASYAHPEKATDYYIKRIMKLAEFCEHYPGTYYYYDADLIRHDPQALLQHLQQWLSLEEPLSENYQLFSQTGKPRLGDSSDNMKKGRIVKAQSNYENIEIPSQLLDQAITETRSHRDLIIKNAIDSMILT